jgi:hypothetical protein
MTATANPIEEMTKFRRVTKRRRLFGIPGPSPRFGCERFWILLFAGIDATSVQSNRGISDHDNHNHESHFFEGRARKADVRG